MPTTYNGFDLVSIGLEEPLSMSMPMAVAPAPTPVVAELPSTDRYIMPNALNVMYDFEEESFYYVYGFNYNCINISLLEFYDIQRSRHQLYPAEIPTTPSSLEIAAYKQGVADVYSFVVEYDEVKDVYVVQIPERQDEARQTYHKMEYASLSEAYHTARSYKNHFMTNNPAKKWNVYPRKDTDAYQALKLKTTALKEPYSFAQVLSILDSIATCTDYENSGDKNYKLLKQAYVLAASNRTTKNLYTPYDIFERIALGYLAFKAKTKFGFVKTDMSRCDIMPEALAVKVYTGYKKEDGSQLWSKSYSNEYAIKCKHCGDMWANNRILTINHVKFSGSACYDCAEAMGFYKCKTCGKTHHDDDICPSYKKMDRGYVHYYSTDVRSLIHKMGKMPDDKKVNGTYLFYGVELEVLPKTSRIEHTAKYNCDCALFGHAVLKSDSSLKVKGTDGAVKEEGFEIVTIPATLEYHRQILWKKFFNDAIFEGKTAAQTVKSWDTKVCGTHVHITRAAMTEMQLSKLLVFYHETRNSEFLSRIAGREVGAKSYYCKCAKKKLAARRDSAGNVFNSTALASSEDHHGAITVSSRNVGKTAEVRIFRGNATYHGVMRSLEFVDATVKWCGVCSADDATKYEAFLKWFVQPEIKSQYPELRKHLIQLKYLTPRFKHGIVPPSKAVPDVVPDELRTA